SQEPRLLNRQTTYNCGPFGRRTASTTGAAGPARNASMKISDQFACSLDPLKPVNDRYLADEQSLVRELAQTADAGESLGKKIRDTEELLVHEVRKNAVADGGLDAFLQQYDLSS